jgi:hypothetical protein
MVGWYVPLPTRSRKSLTLKETPKENKFPNVSAPVPHKENYPQSLLNDGCSLADLIVEAES